jgi:hypothetical protein
MTKYQHLLHDTFDHGAIARITSDDTVRVVILRGAGPIFPPAIRNKGHED